MMVGAGWCLRLRPDLGVERKIGIESLWHNGANLLSYKLVQGRITQ